MNQEMPAHSEQKPFAVIGILGGPGSGKGTQCRLLSGRFRFDHISIGDVLRAEVKREGSEHAGVIEQNMRVGTVGPKEVTVGILKSHILEAAQRGTKLFVLDGFPRNLEQAQYFEETIAPIELVIVLECPDNVLIDRLLPRGRFDDNLENICKRIRTFRETTSQVISFYEDKGKVKTIKAEGTIQAVTMQIARLLEDRERRALGDLLIQHVYDTTKLL
ncbi:adenylate kinase-domain-containing protein [Xylaria sp. FL1042]|nr:adenylate kinase-domain-containing protein [Xylaria sp. FL1042]